MLRIWLPLSISSFLFSLSLSSHFFLSLAEKNWCMAAARLKPSTSQSNAWRIRPQDHGVLQNVSDIWFWVSGTRTPTVFFSYLNQDCNVLFLLFYRKVFLPQVLRQLIFQNLNSFLNLVKVFLSKLKQNFRTWNASVSTRGMRGNVGICIIGVTNLWRRGACLM